jgi:hypothetical protein
MRGCHDNVPLPFRVSLSLLHLWHCQEGTHRQISTGEPALQLLFAGMSYQGAGFARSRLGAGGSGLHPDISVQGSLPGSPSTPFSTRCNMLWSTQCQKAWRQPYLCMVRRRRRRC